MVWITPNLYNIDLQKLFSFARIAKPFNGFAINPAIRVK